MSPASPHDHSRDTAPPSAMLGPPSVVLRSVQLLLAGVIGMAFVGFFVGIRQGAPPPEPQPVVHETPEAHPEAIPATAYRDFDRRRVGLNREWNTTLASLEQPPVDLFAKPERSGAAQRACRAGEPPRFRRSTAGGSAPH